MEKHSRPKVTLESSILGGHPTPKKIPTHWHKKFGSKKLQWEWMKKNMPDGVEVCLVLQSTFGQLDDIQVWLKRDGLVDDT